MYRTVIQKDERKCWNCDNFVRNSGYVGYCIVANKGQGKEKYNHSECKKFIGRMNSL